MLLPSSSFSPAQRLAPRLGLFCPFGDHAKIALKSAIKQQQKPLSMRHLILFTIAILLPVFAFLNFSQNGKDVLDKQTASVIQPTETEDSEDVFEKLPKVFYTEPTNFPSTSNLDHAFFDRIKNPGFYPIRVWEVDLENVNASSAVVIEPNSQKILYHKNIFDSRPIASLSKLMTAVVVIEDMSLTDEILISRAAVETYGDAGGLVVDEKLTVESLLYALLISSSNDAAAALEEYYNAFRVEDNATFVASMNSKAQQLGLEDTFFVEPSGLNLNNRSTAYDLARLSDYVFQIPALRQILSTPVIDVQSVDGAFNHHLVNSNKLLGVMPNVLAGKTGYTEEAGESIAVFVKKGDGADNYLIYIILGSEDRFKAVRQLMAWVDEAYVWEQ